MAAIVPTHGYTVALLAFVLPLGLALRDLRRHPAWLRALARATALLVPSGWLLGLAFGGRFFRYPGTTAVLGVTIPAPGDAGPRAIPVEELAFYLLGFTFMATMYAWWCARRPAFRSADPHVLPAVAGPPRRSATPVGSLPLARPPPPRSPKDEGEDGSRPVANPYTAFLLAVPGVLLAFALALPPGRPGYALFLGLVYVPVFIALAASLRRVVRLDAMLFCTLATLALSVPWEAWLAIPRGWWGYEPAHLLGPYVSPGLPVEAVAVWFLGPVGSSLTVQGCFEVAPSDARLAAALGRWLHPGVTLPLALFSAFSIVGLDSALRWTLLALACLAPPALAWIVGVRRGWFATPDLVARAERPPLLLAATLAAAVFAALAQGAPAPIAHLSLGLFVAVSTITALTTFGLKVSVHVVTAALGAVAAGPCLVGGAFVTAAAVLSWARVRAGVHRPVEVAAAWALALCLAAAG